MKGFFYLISFFFFISCSQTANTTATQDTLPKRISYGQNIANSTVTSSEAQRIIDSSLVANGWNNQDSLGKIDFLTKMLMGELLNRGWIKSTDYLFIDSISSNGETYYLTHSREARGDIKALHHWEYLPEHYIIFDPKEARKEISFGPGYDPKNDKKIKAFDPFNP